MPGFVLDVAATVKCIHGGVATPQAPNPRVLVSGKPTVTVTTPYQVVGCPQQAPCTAALFKSASLRVQSGGLPLLLADSQAQCVPSGAPLVPSIMQTRVLAS